LVTSPHPTSRQRTQNTLWGESGGANPRGLLSLLLLAGTDMIFGSSRPEGIELICFSRDTEPERQEENIMLAEERSDVAFSSVWDHADFGRLFHFFC